MTAIDVHAHVIVPELLRSSAPGEAWRPNVVRDEGNQVVELGGARIRSMVSEAVDVGEIVAAQSRAGVNATLLCRSSAATCRTTGWPACTPGTRIACGCWARCRCRIPSWPRKSWSG
jgi:hypothetical protein